MMLKRKGGSELASELGSELVLNYGILVLNSSELFSELFIPATSVGSERREKVQKLGTLIKKESKIKKEREKASNPILKKGNNNILLLNTKRRFY